MKILHLSTTDIKGGAGIAAYRLHKGLIDSGVDSKMFVQRKYSDSPEVTCSKSRSGKFFDFFCLAIDKVVSNIFGPKSYEITSPALLASFDLDIIDRIEPDIVHLHWICGGFLNPEKISKIKKPIVWTMHDAWPFSGVNHYNGDIRNFVDGNFSQSNFLDKLTWRRKKNCWRRLDNLVAVSPSKWLANEAKISDLFKNFRIENIPNGIYTEVFRKYDQSIARQKYSLPQDKKIILFGAVNPLSGDRKGYKILFNIIQELLKLPISKDLVLAVFGSAEKNQINFGLPTFYIGKISSERELAEVYSAADIFVAPSKEDNLPNTVVESMSCGTPVAAFDIGGMPDMINNKINGLLVAPFDIGLMAKELAFVFENDEYRENLSKEARKKVLENFDIKLIAQKYNQLYNSIINK